MSTFFPSFLSLSSLSQLSYDKKNPGLAREEICPREYFKLEYLAEGVGEKDCYAKPNS